MQTLELIPWTDDRRISEEEAEARLRGEGYISFCWHDVAGANYPQHRHLHDECIWVIEGNMSFEIEGKEYSLGPGDRLMLPARTLHSAIVPKTTGVTYLVGQKRN